MSSMITALIARGIAPPEDPIEANVKLRDLLRRDKLADLELQMAPLKVQAARRQSEMGELALQEARQAQQDDETWRSTVSQFGGDPVKALPSLAGKLSQKSYFSILKNVTDREKEKLGMAKTAGEVAAAKQKFIADTMLGVQANGYDPHSFAGGLHQIVSAYPDEQKRIAGIFHSIASHQTPPEAIRAMVDSAVAANPDAQSSLIKRAGEKRDAELHPLNVRKQAADAKRAEDVAEGKEPITPYQQEQMNAAQLERDAQRAFQASQGALNRGVTVRGQNMTDARARELAEITRDTKPATEAERRSFGFYTRAKQADETLDALAPVMDEKGFVGQLVYEYGPNAIQSGDNQAYRQAQRAFTEARLRRDSGAAVPPHEYQNDAKTYFPQPGDSKTTLEQKRKARKAVLQALRVSAGRAIREGGEEPGTVTPGAVTVTDPRGVTHHFATREQAEAFKQAAGIK